MFSNNLLNVFSGLYRLQWLGIQENGLHPSSFSPAGQLLFMMPLTTFNIEYGLVFVVYDT